MASDSMPNDPGNPDNTDPEFTSPNEAEQEAQDAAEAQADPREDALNDAAAEGQPESEIDPELEAEIDEALADVEGESQTEGNSVEAELAERTEDLQRVSAEYANYRRRTERDRATVIENAKASVITELLPLLDDLDLARQHGDLNEGPLKAFGDKFANVLKGQKLEAFGAEGDAFDPEIHEAVQDLSSGEEKVVGTVLRKGYRLGERLVRNAMVIIADPAESAE